MHTVFPLFSSHHDLAEQYWRRLLCPGDTAIDATCGNGKDTLKLASIVLKLGNEGRVIGIDIQPEAIRRTEQLLKEYLTEEELQRVRLHMQSHAQFPPLEGAQVRLIVYNLGYLPGSDKTVKTKKSSTLESVQAALNLLLPGGALSITCYPGHPEGKEEQAALLTWAKTLPPQVWNVCHHEWVNASAAPSLLVIQRSAMI